ncbi:asparagine synthetase [Perkinsus chesapeaki]|uniref:asparagine synthase (glutamine-hydrolyzing) n=1 Tax=Perkinsus chesapeaki TaxID=330153 RepID=A0A7J6M2U4_PERCH|nr:asparagine synthetase [Perkinsus chesapeaki]
MMAEVPYGVLLSGGLDSSLVASIAARYRAKMTVGEGVRSASSARRAGTLPPFARLRSYCVGLAGSPDLKAAKEVAEFLGTFHREFTFTLQDGINALEDVIHHLETFDVTTIRASTPMYLMTRLIKATGVKMVLSGEGADEVFGGYLYFHKAPNPQEFHEECIRKIDKLHMYDCLRANKAMAAFGVEARVPFLDRNFLEVAMSMDPELKMVGRNGNTMEKHILRAAFDDPDDPYLPPNVLWRQKEQFSDGVGYGWIDKLRDYAEEKVTDEMMETAEFRYPESPPKTKEAYLYRQIFENPNILKEGDNDYSNEDNEAIYFDIDVRELIKVDDVAEEHQLGPNGAMVFAMQDLELNSAWLVDRIEALPIDDYILFDCPGQIELYTHLTVMPHLVQLLTDRRGLDMRLTALNLTDCSVLASEGGNNFISAALSSLAIMLHVELPHLNVLTKCDTLTQFGNQLNRTLDQYLCCGGYSGISSLLPTYLENEKRGLTRPRSPLVERQDKLVASLCELIDDYGEVSFIPLSVDDKESMGNLLAHADKANGYAFSHTDPQLCAIEIDEGHDEYSDYYQQRYVNGNYLKQEEEEDEDEERDVSSTSPHTCGYCGSSGAYMRCSRCQRAVYCDQRCQRLDWKRHKAEDCIKEKEEEED